MKIQTQMTIELTQPSELIKEMSVAMLTALDEAEGAIMSRPMSPLEMCEQGAIWFLTDPNSSKVKHLQVLKLSFTNESTGTYVSIAGHGEIVTDRERIESLWTEFAMSCFPDGIDSFNLAHLRCPEICASSRLILGC